jgi:hypothetical protein
VPLVAPQKRLELLRTQFALYESIGQLFDMWRVVVHGGAGLDKGMILPYPDQEYTDALSQATLAAADILKSVCRTHVNGSSLGDK